MDKNISILALLFLLSASCAKNTADPGSDEHDEGEDQTTRQQEPVINTDPWSIAGTPVIPQGVAVGERMRSLIFEDGIRMDYNGDTAGDGNGPGNTDDEEICRQAELDGELFGVCMELSSDNSITCSIDDALQSDCEEVYSQLGNDFECESGTHNGDPALACSDGWAIVANGEPDRSKTICRVLLSNHSGRCLNAYKEEDDGTGTLVPVDTEELILDMQQSTWSGYDGGYSANPLQTFDNDPPLSPLASGHFPEGASVNYKTLDPTVCTVDNDQDDDNGVRGTLTPSNGSAPAVCTVVLTIEAEGYVDHIFAYDVELVLDNDSTWSGYSTALAAAPFNGIFYVGESLSPDAIVGTLSAPESSYQSEDESVCTVDEDSGEVTAVTDGTCIVNRIVSQDGYLDKRLPTAITINPLRTYQGISWADFPDGDAVAVGDTTSSLSIPVSIPAAIGMDSHTIEWKSGDCNWVGGSTRTITFTNTTPCVITVSIEKRGYADWVEDFTVTPSLGTQTGMSWSPSQSNGVVGTDLIMDPFSGTLANNETVHYVVSDAGDTGCHFEGINGEEAHTLNFEADGTCVVQLLVSRSGYENWNSSDVSITVAKGTITVNDWGSYEDVLNASTTEPPELSDVVPSHVSKSYTSSDTTECTVEQYTGIVRGVSTGNNNCSIVLTLSGTGYNDRTQTYTFSVLVGVAELNWSGYDSESISIADSATPPTLLPPTSSTPGVLFAYQSTTNTVCNPNAGTGALTILTAGTCTITLTAYASNYRSIKKNFVITITQIPQNALSPGDAADVYGMGATLSTGETLSVDGGATLPTGGTGALSYGSEDEDVCTVASDGTVTAEGVGTCIISVYFAGDTDTEASNALEVLNVEVDQGTQTFTPWSNPYGAYPQLKVNGNSLRIKNPAPEDHGHGDLEYSSMDTSICEVDTGNGEITPIGGGDCTIQARYTGNDHYLASDYANLITITIRKFQQYPLSVPDDPYGTALAITVGEGTLELENRPEEGLTPTEYRPENGDDTVCSVDPDNGEVTPRTPGSCVVEARYSESGEYHPSGYVTLATITVSEGSLVGVLSWSPSTTTGETGVPLLLDPIDGIDSSDDITYTVESGNCSFDSGDEEADRTVNFSTIGTCTVSATVIRSGYSSWTSASIDINVSPGPQVLTAPQNPYGNNPVLSVGAGNLNIVNPPTSGQGSTFYRSSDTNKCTVDTNGNVTPVAPGECVIEVQYTGTTDYIASDFVEILRIMVNP